MNVNADIFAFPVSLLLGAAFLLMVYILHRWKGGGKFVGMMSEKVAAIVSLSVICAIILIEGIWACGAVHSVIFIIAMLVFLLCLGLAILRGFAEHKKACFLLCHGGLFVILFASFFGSPDTLKLKAALKEGGEQVNYAYGLDGALNPLPMTLELKSFTIDYYEGTAMPKQYTSSLLIDGKERRVKVNSPCSVGQYAFFQEGFQEAPAGRYSVIGISRDPWLPIVYIGMALLAAGCLLMIGGGWNMKVFLPIAIVVAVAFTALSVARINFGTLMPALRSLWFVPHLIIYMAAYAFLAIALVIAVIALIRGRKSAEAVDKMVRISSALIAIGMLCGAVWAREAWGDYWTWDPKESLAAVTWLITLIYIHINPIKRKILIIILLLAFISLQFTWYGVNYLPSAKQSLHTYNTR